ncbi:hypothetical protein J3E68DRAFT_322921 [Trichoderma sp. SZMC 28012]
MAERRRRELTSRADGDPRMDSRLRRGNTVRVPSPGSILDLVQVQVEVHSKYTTSSVVAQGTCPQPQTQTRAYPALEALSVSSGTRATARPARRLNRRPSRHANGPCSLSLTCGKGTLEDTSKHKSTSTSTKYKHKHEQTRLGRVLAWGMFIFVYCFFPHRIASQLSSAVQVLAGRGGCASGCSRRMCKCKCKCNCSSVELSSVQFR